MFASSRDAVAPRIRLDISAKKAMLSVFFTSRKLLELDSMSKTQKYDQEYWVQKVIPELQCERSRFARRKTLIESAAQMDNSRRHNRMKLTNALDKLKVIWALHPVYSPDLSPCDFWLFGMLKHWMADRQLQSPKENLDMVTELWDHITFDEVQIFFRPWMDRL
jgi:hypothetical protein